MDKSFNDDELSDIMKEIEALEQDFQEDDIHSASPVMAELAEMSPEESVPVATPAAKNVVPMASPVAHVATSQKATSSTDCAPHTSMAFKVQGNLSLELSFDIGGKVVSLAVSEAGLSIEMEGGVKFSVPVTETPAAKKAA